MTLEGLLNLSDAARELGCHVETLRVWVRTGRLPAVRGPHGAYLVTREALEAQPTPARGRPSREWPEMLTREAERRSWKEVERLLAQDSDDIQIELRLLKVLRDDSELWPELYRLVSVHRLRAIGWHTPEIAIDLEISERHVRRLAARWLWRRLRYLLAIRRATVDRRLRRERAQELIAILREQLRAEGVPERVELRSHDRIDADRIEDELDLPTRAMRWKRHKINAYEEQTLLDAGLTEEELDAIWVEGLTHDEINHLLMQGYRSSRGRRVAIRTKSDPLDPVPERWKNEPHGTTQGQGA